MSSCSVCESSQLISCEIIKVHFSSGKGYTPDVIVFIRACHLKTHSVSGCKSGFSTISFINDTKHDKAFSAGGRSGKHGAPCDFMACNT
ncbi:MAG: hypothetical protein BWY70_00666 [Bacteroidetes bacterium ADurb.Bin408]|nr:MAG: hypothetical protein BWY70_00666 [Bacteroidetes bacterium ADurb.Bin408]